MSQKMKEKSKGMRIKTSLNLRKENNKLNKGITLIALVITIVLNCCEAAVERMLRKVKELKREKTSDII